MILTIDHAIASDELAFMLDKLSQASFIDGQLTAGWHAKQVKHNTQLERNSKLAQELQKIVTTSLLKHPLLSAAVQPKFIHSLLFSRYEIGMSYGNHIDNALMGGSQFWRSDVSFTLFLSPPECYGGGELAIECADGERSYKLQAGSLLIYPSSFLHRVETVTEGVRLVAVGWIQSLVRDPAKREILFDIDTVKRSLFVKAGKSIEFDLLAKTHANLLRKWAD